MRGILRPCRSHLGPELGERWQAHLCGLCLTLRDVAGQPERALTGYDVLLLSVLVEAQAGVVRTTSAGPCALRAFRSATVVDSTDPAARLAAAGALLTGAAGLTDKVADGDLPAGTRRPAGRLAGRLSLRGRALAAQVGLDPRAVLAAPTRAARAERRPEAGLPALLAPSGEAVASLFAHTAVVAGRPGNADALAELGRAFGALVHLLDAVEDLHEDARTGAFNPLAATGTPEPAARALAHDLRDRVARALDGVEMADRALVDALLGRELTKAVSRAFPSADGHSCGAAVPAQRSSTGTLAAALALLTLVPGVFIGGSYGGGGCGGGPRRRRQRYGGYGPGYGSGGYGPGYGYGGGYPPPRRGYVSYGPSCGQLLACNCCANLACNACCCEGCGDV